ncbi:MAG TPA: T9SS type A sorting domain-containing protein [Bacteroidetes bacterium]|nr:T9SS type A sorting domain-containing protein [Bacteroidota bacterium]
MKKQFTILSLILCSLSLFAQPMNDDCSGIVDLGEAPVCPFPDTFTNVGATLSVVFSDPQFNIPSCFNGGFIDRDVWFSFMVPSDGSVVDFVLRISGIDGPNGSIQQPQVAIYRGECLLDEMQELDCASAPAGENEVELELQGLTPGLTYFLRVSDWSASATPNWGDFVVCVKEPDPIFIMGETASTELCEGFLFDSGGPDNDYQNDEDATFTVCPTQPHQCITINVDEFNIEAGFDALTIFAGANTNAPAIAALSGSGIGTEFFAQSECVTFQFTSDGSVIDTGFGLSWTCSPDTCDIPPPSTCDAPTNIPSLPFVMTGASTCGAGNQLLINPCDPNVFLTTEDVFFTYDSPGNECISVAVTGANITTSVAIFDSCPTDGIPDCVAQASSDFFVGDAMINGAFLETPGTYYIVVDNATFCTPFDISVESVVCPVIFPSAALCEDALGLNGCGALPAIVSVAPGQGDPNAINDNNTGCWGGFPPNFTWFFFQAQADGEFAFTMQSANANEASDIDFQVWGPVGSFEEMCGFSFQTQPVRSSYAGGAVPTGLANINPFTGEVVIDTCEDAIGDAFVSALDVVEGEFYMILINDWGGAITSGAVSIDFDGTTPGVLNALPGDFTVSSDTTLCPGESVQLEATGGDLYQWFPIGGLSCSTCPDPIATITEPTTYNVIATSICAIDTLQVNVGFTEADAGPDLSVCIGATTQILALSSFSDSTTTYTWTDPDSLLSCTDCLQPTATIGTLGVYEFILTADGAACSDSDTMTITVLTVQETEENIVICEGDTIDVFGSPVGAAGVFSETFTTNSGCDSTHTITVSVAPAPSTFEDIEICEGETIEVFGSPVGAAGVFSQTFTTDSGCDSTHTITVSVAPAPMTSEDIEICEGETIEVFGSPVGAAGVFSETFTTGAGCDSIHTITVSVAPAPSTFEDIEICEGETIEVFGSPVGAAGVFSQTFTTGAGCDSIHTITVSVGASPETFEDMEICANENAVIFGNTVNTAGVYTEVFTASSGCDSTHHITLSVKETAATAEEIFICFGETTTIFGMPASSSGVHEMTFTGANGCDSTHTITLVVYDEISSTAQSTDVSCFGEADGNATVVAAGGNGNFSYAWSNGSTSATADGLAAGSYSVTITDGEGCSTSTSVSISEPDLAVVTAAGTDVTCTELGSASANASGSVGGFAYAWDNGENGASISGLTAGTYNVTATDTNGCTATAAVQISGALGPESASISVDQALMEVGSDDGILSASVTGGTPPYTYEWSNGAMGTTLEDLPAGAYSVTATDANGCTVSASANLFVAACTGGKIWNDRNRDGCQDGGELGVAGVELLLLGTDIWGNLVTAVTTSAINGEYIFEGLPPGEYQVDMAVPDGYALTAANACSDDFTDSDFAANGTGLDIISLVEGHCCLIVDGGIYDACLNVYDPGAICCDQYLCGPGNDPAALTSLSPAVGANQVEYMWVYSNLPNPPAINGTWIPVLDAFGQPVTTLAYDPGPIQETTHFARCARAAGCTEWLETDPVTITVGDVAVAAISEPGAICVGDPVTFYAAENPPGAAYFWDFGHLASPSTSTSASPTVVWNQWGYNVISLSVTYGGCTSTDELLTVVSNSPTYCGTALGAPVGGNQTSVQTADFSEGKRFAFYPNPATNVLNIEWSGDIEPEITVEIMSMEGKVLLKEKAGKDARRFAADISGFNAGLYMLRLRYSGGGQEVFKWVKQ